MTRDSRTPRSAAWWCLLAYAMFAASPGALAQYTYNPRSDDEQQPGIRYFGAATNEKDEFLSGVTIVLIFKSFTFVFLTDETGRFHGKLPLDSSAERVSATCSKSGYEQVRVTKRSTALASNQAVQVDCLMRLSRTR